MKRYDTVFFWHISESGRKTRKSGTIVAVNSDHILISSRDRLFEVAKELVMTARDKLLNNK